MRKVFDSIPVFLGFIFLLSSCASSQSRIEENGLRAFTRIKNRSILDEKPEDLRFVKCILNALRPSSNTHANGKTDWEVVILKDPVANAYALPGKKIAINSGLFRVAVNEDQVAAVLAHEIAHVEAGHFLTRTNQQIVLESLALVSNILQRSSGSEVQGIAAALTVGSTALQLGLIYPFGKIQEEEADLKALEIMDQAGFQPKETIAFWQNMDVYGTSGSDDILSTHPSHLLRMKRIEENLSSRVSTSLITTKLPPSCMESL